MLWYLTDPGRLNAEREAIDALQGTACWLTGTHWQLDGSRIAVDAVLQIHGQEWRVRLTYPALFPSAPITVRPQADETWSSHQYGDGTLCVEWGPDNWHPGVTGAQMLESVHLLLEMENGPGTKLQRTVPSRHQLTTGQELRNKWWRVYIGPDLQQRLACSPAPDWVDFSLHFQAESILIVMQALRESDARWENPDVPKTLKEELGSCCLRHAVVRRVSRTLSTADDLSDVKNVDKLLEEHDLPPIADVKFEGDEHAASTILIDACDTVHFLYRSESSQELSRVSQVRSDSGRENTRVAVELQPLTQMAVGIVGLGSVGSKIALTLARAGVGKFLLVDEDIFLPENVCRNALDLHNVCEHKATAVAAALQRVSPAVKVKAERVHLTGQESNAIVNGVLQRLAECDLLIDATADSRVFGLVSAASAAEKPMLWMEVFSGGIGGLVARSRPGKDPSPMTMRSAYLQFAADHPSEDLEDLGRYSAETEDGQKLVATDADVSVIASMSAQVALDTLLDREPSAYPNSLYLIGFRRAWVFDAPFHVIPLGTEGLSEPETPDIDETMAVKGFDFVRSLLSQVEACE